MIVLEQLPFTTNMNQELQQHQTNFKESEEKYGENRYKRDLFLVPMKLIWKSTERLKKLQEQLIFWVTLLGIPALLVVLQNNFSLQQPLADMLKKYATQISIFSISILVLVYLFLIFYVFLNMSNIENKDCFRIAIFKKRNKLMYNFHKNFDSYSTAPTHSAEEYERQQERIRVLEEANRIRTQMFEAQLVESEEQFEVIKRIGNVLNQMIKNFRKAKNLELDYVDLDLFDVPFTLYRYENKTFERMMDYRTKKSFPKTITAETQKTYKFSFLRLFKKKTNFFQFRNEFVFKFHMEDGSIWFLTYYDYNETGFLSFLKKHNGYIYDEIPELLKEHLDYIIKK